MSKRRAYPKTGYSYQQPQPQPQFGAAPNGYDYNGAAAGGVAPQYSQNYQQPGVQPELDPYGRVDQVTGGIQNLNINTQPVYGGHSVPPPAGMSPMVPGVQPGMAPGMQPMPNMAPMQPMTPGMPNMGAGMAPMTPGMPAMGGSGFGGYAGANNQLYSTDLLTELPPPIENLALPPPPIVLPPNASVTQNPESNSSPEFFRSTLNMIPTTNTLLKKSKLPLALVVRPYVTLHEEDHPLPVVSDTLIARCRRCRSYINPFITFAEDGRRWRCNFCNLLNDCPSGFDFNSATGQQLNRYERHELNYGVVEFLAPSEYLVRPPQPLVYVFLLEVTSTAVKSGLLATAARTILESLDRIPDREQRTKIAILGVDSSLHFFKFPSENSEAEEGAEEQDDEEAPEMLVVSDLEEPFLPCPDGLLVNLVQARKYIEKLLESINSFFIDSMNVKFALGPALKAAHKLCSSFGGKIEVISCTLPNIGLGSLKIRDEEPVSGKPKEAAALLTNANSFYKSFAVECNKTQVTVDMFLASSTYQDVASMSNLPRYTAGQTYFYPAWSAAREEDVTKFSKELSNHLSMEIALEAVLRVRASNGIRMSGFYGNFFNRSSDLCSFPTFPRDQSYVIGMTIEEHISKPSVALQAAVLHTTSWGERRIRVMTLTIPTTQILNEVYASADQLAIAAYYAHKAIEKLLSSTLKDSKDLLDKYLIDILTCYKKEIVPGNVGTSSPLQLSTSLKMLPLLIHTMQKHISIRSGKVPSDHRAAGINILTSSPIPKLIKSIYPTIYCLHRMEDSDGLPEEIEPSEEDPNPKVGEIVMPKPVNASAMMLENYGLYLFDNSTELFLWIGGDAVPQLCEDVFGIPDIFQIPYGKLEMPVVEGSEFNQRIRNIIGKIRESKSSVVWQNLYIVRGGSASEPPNLPNAREVGALRLWATSLLVEDRVNDAVSYKEYLNIMRAKTSA